MKKNNEKLLDLLKIKAIIQKNFLVLIRDKTRLLPLLLFPVTMIVIFGYTTGNIPQHIATGIVLYDHSPLSQQIQQEISNNQVFSIKYVISTEGEGTHLLDQGKVQALIEIPPNLQDDIESGQQTGITIIVDESDSAVAATAKNTLNRIVSLVSRRLSQQKISELQSSVDKSTEKILNYYSKNINYYGKIYSDSYPTVQGLKQSKKIIDLQTDIMMELIPLPRLTAYSDSSNITYTENNTYVLESSSSASSLTMINFLKKASELISSAQDKLEKISSISKIADAQLKKQNEFQSYNDNVITPLNNIKVFTQYDKDSMVQPLVYQERPAYGTGKRAIDFVIASIIALTIFQGAVMGMGRAIAGEKREGSLTRVFLTPTSNATIIFGTLAFYIVFELFRSTFLIMVAMLFFHIKIQGSLLSIALILVIYVGVSTSVGMIFSSMVKSEQQYMGISMLVTIPTIFLAGVFFPLQAMPKIFQGAAMFLPITYAAEALRGIMIKGLSISFIIKPLLILIIFFIILISIVFIVFKRDIE